MKEQRPSWDSYFLRITEDVSERATCVKRKVGAIIVKDHHILATGYNGAPKGFKHCTEATCLRLKLKVPSGQRHELCRGLHAEQNAIIQAAVQGVKIEGGTMYCTYQPCVICVKMMLNAGIVRLVYAGGYPDELAEEMLKESKMEVLKHD
jgi:dCMP deaminase